MDSMASPLTPSDPQRRLRASEEKFAAAFKHAPVIVTISTLEDGVLVEVNDKFLEVSGYQREEVVGKTVLELNWIQAPDRDRLLQRLQAHRRVIGEEVCVWARDGARTDCLYQGEVITFAGKAHLLSIAVDITQSKRAAEALRASEERYRLLFNNAHDAVFLYGVTAEGLPGPFLEVNEVAGTRLGYTRTELLARTLFDINPPERRAVLLTRWRELLARRHLVFETEHVARDGRRWPVEVGVHVLELQGRTMVLSVARDLSERKAAEARLRVLSQAVEQSPASVMITDHRGLVEYVNAKFVQVSGYTLAEVSGQNPRLLKSGAMPAATYRHLWETLSRGHEWRGELHNKKKNGELYWEAAWISPILDEAGRITHYLAVKEDITARRQVESERARLFNMLDASVNEVYAFDAVTLRFQYANAGALRNLGYSLEALRALTPLEVKPDYDRAAFERLVAPLRGRERALIQFETSHRRADGSRYPVEVRLQLFEQGTAASFLAVVQDITERRRLEEQLRQAQKMEAVGQLAGGVAHDFNNILAATMMRLSLLQEDPAVSPDLRASLHELEEGANRAASLTRQLLMFSRRQAMRKQVLDLNQVLAGFLRMLRRLLGAHIELELVSTTADLWLEADAGMIEQVVLNLSLNARDAMPGGGRLTISTGAVEFTADDTARQPEARPGRFVRLGVVDTGCGMDAATVARVFEPFFTTKEVGKGTGLGLATVYGIVKQHQGWIEVESLVGRGSTFRVYLPALARLEHPSEAALSAEASRSLGSV